MANEVSSARRLWDDFTAELTTRSLVYILFGAAVSSVVAVLCELAGFPIYLDATGVVVVAMLAGPWSALVAGFLTNAFLGSVFNTTFYAYAPANMVIGLVAGYLFLYGGAGSLLRRVGSAVVLSVVAVIAGLAITLSIHGSLTGIWATAVVDVYLVTGSKTFVTATDTVLQNVVISSLIVETGDKLLTVFLAYLIATDIPTRYRPENGKRILPHTESFIGSERVGIGGIG